MPGRNPNEAVEAFLEPLRDAVSVLEGYSKLLVSKKGGYYLGGEYSWMLVGPEGMKLGSAGRLHAQMWFKIVSCDPTTYEGKVRVTTLGYLYRIELPSGQDAVRAHWHPQRNSNVAYPHVHIQPDLAGHFITPRVTFENVVQWCIQLGAPLSCDEETAARMLDIAQANHLTFRSWNVRPGEREA